MKKIYFHFSSSLFSLFSIFALLSLLSLFLFFLLISLFSENANAQNENSSVAVLENSNISSENFYARRGSFRSSSSKSSFKKTSSKKKNVTQKKKTDDKKSGFLSGFGGLITGLIGGALLASLLSGMGLEGLADFAGILMWGILGLLAFFLIKSFLAKRKKQEQEEENRNQSFSKNNF